MIRIIHDSASRKHGINICMSLNFCKNVLKGMFRFKQVAETTGVSVNNGFSRVAFREVMV